MKKLNNKGYMLVEIIMAFAITFALIYFLMDMVINLKNKNDDLLVDTVIKTDQTIISNKLMDSIIRDTKDEGNIEFKCENISVDGNSVKYNDDIIGIVDDSATISYDAKDNCSNENGRIHINIPVEIKQMPDKNYDIVVDYRYKLMYCNPNQSFNCKDVHGNWINNPDEEYDFIYTGQCEVKDDGNGDWRIKFLTGGEFTTKCNLVIDAFLVGGGGGGAGNTVISDSYRSGGGGGGGGYTITSTYKVKSETKYSVTIGLGGAGGTGKGKNGSSGGDTIAFNTIAKGGMGALGKSGGSGGSGGGGGAYKDSGTSGGGGENGACGVSNSGSGGVGQFATTGEFGNEFATHYAGGGGGGNRCKDDVCGSGGAAGGEIGGKANGSGKNQGADALANTGGGGGGASGGKAGSGGSGIVVIRNSKITLEEFFDFTYDGYYTYYDDGSGIWKIKFLTDGVLNVNDNVNVDTFLVGGGGGGGNSVSTTDHRKYGGGGGGGGQTITSNANLVVGTSYQIVIGDGGECKKDGGDTSAFNVIARGGIGAINSSGGTGGSGGGGGGHSESISGEDGGSNGGNGKSSGYAGGGTGQGTTTKEFGEEDGLLYSGGGGGGAGSKEKNYFNFSTSFGEGGAGFGAKGGKMGRGGTAAPNSGGGGGGGGTGGDGGSGGSGIVIIRKSKNDVIPIVNFNYTGNYTYIDDGGGNWRIKFLSSGTFTPSSDLDIDVFLVGGGGGGGNSVKTTETRKYGGGGGGGGQAITSDFNLVAGTSYQIVIGEGGESETNGGDTSAFNIIAKGGIGAINASGGTGGSGGGGGGYSESVSGEDGGSNGENGKSSSYAGGGTGQGTTTKEFGEEDGLLYSGGGGGGAGSKRHDNNYVDYYTSSGLGGDGGGGKGAKGGNGGNGITNTGGGGGGGSGGGNGGQGGSGIVVIRKKR